MGDRRARGDHREAPVQALGSPDIDLVHDHDHRGPRALPRIDAEIADTAGDDGPDVGLLESRATHRLLDHPAELRLGHRDLHQHGVGALPEAIEVLGELEDLARVDADPLEDAVPVEQAVVEDRDLARVPVVPGTVDPDGGHAGSSSGERPAGIARPAKNLT